jgi:hypothetical protein|tara:strand:+ start:99 stop:308 length:210 start_codon:yes stop_codon:yes gene_type:complete
MTNKRADSMGILIMILIITLITLLSSCGVNRGLTNEQVKHRDNIDYELDKLYLNYSYQRDSLIIEFYKK